MTADQLAQILDEIGKRIGPAGEAVWRSAVLYKQVEAGAAIVVPLLLGLIGLVVLIRTGGAFTQSVKDDEFSGAAGLALVAAFAMLVGFGVFFANLAVDLPTLVAPQYAALKDVISAVTGK